jgi:hypothetical protein
MSRRKGHKNANFGLALKKNTRRCVLTPLPAPLAQMGSHPKKMKAGIKTTTKHQGRSPAPWRPAPQCVMRDKVCGALLSTAYCLLCTRHKTPELAAAAAAPAPQRQPLAGPIAKGPSQVPHPRTSGGGQIPRTLGGGHQILPTEFSFL